MQKNIRQRENYKGKGKLQRENCKKLVCMLTT